MRALFLAFLTIGTLTGMMNTAHARPISYAGGTTVMQNNDGDMNDIHIHYSPTPFYSLGYKGEYWRDEDWWFHGAQFNYLLNRSNKAHSQGNFYLKSGAGVAVDGDTTNPAGFVGFAYDWEDRDYFVSYENRATYAGDVGETGNDRRFYRQTARFGFTPYVAEYGNVHTWLMLQVGHSPEADDPITVTPLVRVFQGDVLGEAGISTKGDVLLNWIVRF